MREMGCLACEQQTALTVHDHVVRFVTKVQQENSNMLLMLWQQAAGVNIGVYVVI